MQTCQGSYQPPVPGTFRYSGRPAQPKTQAQGKCAACNVEVAIAHRRFGNRVVADHAPGSKFPARN